MTPVDVVSLPEYRAALEREAAAAGDTKPPEALPQAIRAIDAPPQEPLGWLVRDLWPRAQIGLFVGDGGAFKSSAALHMAAAIAGGYPVFERYPVEAARPVLIVSAEDDLAVVLMRLEAFIAGHGWDRERVLRNVHIIADGEPTLGLVLWKLHLLAEAERIRPGFIILDPWAELLGGDENSNTDARPAIKFLRKLASICDAGVAVVHHAGKMGGKEEKRALDRIRGASALPSAARVILFFEWRSDGVYVENLKMSRAERLEPFLITRAITTAPGNRAQWVTARVTLRSALPFAETWVIGKLREYVGRDLGPTSTILRQMAAGSNGPRNQDLDKAMKRLEFDRIITTDRGKGVAKHWRLSDPNYQPPQFELIGEDDDAAGVTTQPDPSGYENGGRLTSTEKPYVVGNHEDAQDAQNKSRENLTSGVRAKSLGNKEDAHMPKDAQTGGRLPEFEMPPLKGGASHLEGIRGGEMPNRDPWADRDFLPSDLDAEDDERRGMQEG